jgi:type 1 glutamine amidotransferase
MFSIRSIPAAAALALLLVGGPLTPSQALNVLVFSKVGSGAFVHSSIPDGNAAVQAIGQARGWNVTVTASDTAFTAANLAKYDVVVWNNTAGDVLNAAEQAAFQGFIENGGGYVGIHAANDETASPGNSSYWPWYKNLVGAYFLRHPAGTPTASIIVEDPSSPVMAGVPNPWTIADEWYEWQTNPRTNTNIHILMRVDETTYSGGQMGDHPFAWYQEYDGGRAFFTGLGHPTSTFSDTTFRKLLTNAIIWTAGKKVTVDGLLVDLDADKGLTLEETNRVTKWTNQAPGTTARNFTKEDGGRTVVGSGRPTLLTAVTAINNHNSLAFRSQELVNQEEDTFDSLSKGSGFTWLAIVKPYAQQVGTVTDVNMFLGNLKNGGNYEGFWAGFKNDNTFWGGPRNGITFGRFDANNPLVAGPVLTQDRFYLLAGRLDAGTSARFNLYVSDTVVRATNLCVINPAANSSKLAIGTERDAVEHPGGESFDGELARVLIYKRPLSNAELAQTFSALNKTYFAAQPTLVDGRPTAERRGGPAVAKLLSVGRTSTGAVSVTYRADGSTRLVAELFSLNGSLVGRETLSGVAGVHTFALPSSVRASAPLLLRMQAGGVAQTEIVPMVR